MYFILVGANFQFRFKGAELAYFILKQLMLRDYNVDFYINIAILCVKSSIS